MGRNIEESPGKMEKETNDLLSTANETISDLLIKKNELIIELPEKLRKFVLNDDNIMNLVYPIKDFPQKVKSVSLDKNSNISGKLIGIKGQYLYLNKEKVFNVRKHQGYLVDFNIY